MRIESNNIPDINGFVDIPLNDLMDIDETTEIALSHLYSVSASYEMPEITERPLEEEKIFDVFWNVIAN